MDDDRPRVEEEEDADEHDDHCCRDEIGVDLADVDKGDYDGTGSFEVVDKDSRQISVKQSKVIGELVDENSGGSGIEEGGGTAEDAVEHGLMQGGIGVEHQSMQEVIFENQSNEVKKSDDCKNSPEYSDISTRKAILAVADKIII